MENEKKRDAGQSYWQGERVRLRAMEPADWEAYFAWNGADDQARRLSFVPSLQSREAVRRFAERTATDCMSASASSAKVGIYTQGHYFDQFLYGRTAEEFAARGAGG